mmetsp:Transcript_38603/g.101972  ORF Transcript_38603/g.101972 Transcript_38603/m.101972 type:complete len:206 (+) Transcript_38603:1108-1725(+)
MRLGGGQHRRRLFVVLRRRGCGGRGGHRGRRVGKVAGSAQGSGAEDGGSSPNREEAREGSGESGHSGRWRRRRRLRLDGRLLMARLVALVRESVLRGARALPGCAAEDRRGEPRSCGPGGPRVLSRKHAPRALRVPGRGKFPARRFGRVAPRTLGRAIRVGWPRWRALRGEDRVPSFGGESARGRPCVPHIRAAHVDFPGRGARP